MLSSSETGQPLLPWLASFLVLRLLLPSAVSTVSPFHTAQVLPRYVLPWDAEQLPPSELTACHLNGETCLQSPLCLRRLLALYILPHQLREPSKQAL